MAGELIIPEGCMQTTTSWTMTGKANPLTCTMGVRVTDTEDITGVCDEVRNGWYLTGAIADPAYMLTGWTLQETTGIYNNGGIMEGYSSTGAPVVGTASVSALMIVSSAMLLQKRTGRVGRHFRGRMYVPVLGLNEGSIDAMGNIAGSTYTEAATKMAVTTDFWLDAETWNPVLLHYDSVITPGYTDITSFALQQKTATQRRRLRS